MGERDKDESRRTRESEREREREREGREGSIPISSFIHFQSLFFLPLLMEGKKYIYIHEYFDGYNEENICLPAIVIKFGLYFFFFLSRSEE